MIKTILNENKRVIKAVAILLLLLIVVFVASGCFRKEPKYEAVKPLYVKTLTKMNSGIDDLTNVSWDDRGDRFYFSQLDTPREKLIYLLIEQSSEKYMDKVTVYDVQNDVLWDIIAAVWADNPELFWLYDSVSNTEVDEEGLITTLITFNVPENIDRDMTEVRRVANNFLATIPEDASDYEKVKMVFDWIGESTDYESGDRDQDLRSVFIDKKSVCAGFANSFQYLCTQLNIPCASVTGYAERDYVEEGNEYHEWNIVKIDGKTYWVDTTWGDSSRDENGNEWPHNYNYLCMSDDDIEEIYRIDKRYRNFGEKKEYEYPSCPEDDLDYYRIMSDEKDIFFSEYDYEKVVEYIKGKFYNGETSGVELQFASQEDYRYAIETLIDMEVIFDIIWEVFPEYGGATVDSIQDNDFNYLCFSVALE